MKWIKMTEREPGDEYVIVYASYDYSDQYGPIKHHVTVGYRSTYNGQWYELGNSEDPDLLYHVTHWMPLPEPPEEKMIGEPNE